MKRTYKILLSLALACVFIAIILSFSEQSGEQSHSVSQKVSSKIVNTFLSDKDSYLIKEGSIESVAIAFDGPVRKLAHITIYTGLGLLLISAMWFIFDYDLRFWHIFVVLIAVFAVGAFDESVQFYSGGRGSSIRDVFIDSFGGTIGIYLFFIVKDFFKHLVNGIKKEKSKRQK